MLKIKNNEGTNCVARFFYNKIQNIIEDKFNQSRYERSLYYSATVGNTMLGILMFPLASLMLIMTEKSSQLPQILLIRQESLTLPLLMSIVLMPL
jgi:3-hydroxy-3-methylglutaryl CoA synthase